MMKTGVAVLYATAATTLCQAFHIPARGGGSMSMSSRLRQQTHHQHRRPHDTLRRPGHAHEGSSRYRRHRASVIASMSAAEEAVEVSSEVEEDAGKEGEEMEDDATVAAANIEKQIKAQERPKRVLTEEEKEYLKRLESAPTLYKRTPDAETIASVGYDGAFVSLEERRSRNYKCNPTIIDDNEKEVMLLRIVVFGAGKAEEKFLKNLSDKAAGKLVSGLYVLWDPTVWEMSRTIVEIPFINIHELGSKNTKDPAKIAQHASFLGAHMLIIASEPAQGPEFVAKVKKEALQRGVTFVGPDVAGEVGNGNMETFTKLVQGTREAIEPS